jgi:hypothetical protein
MSGRGAIASLRLKGLQHLRSVVNEAVLFAATVRNASQSDINISIDSKLKDFSPIYSFATAAVMRKTQASGIVAAQAAVRAARLVLEGWAGVVEESGKVGMHPLDGLSGCGAVAMVQVSGRRYLQPRKCLKKSATLNLHCLQRSTLRPKASLLSSSSHQVSEAWFGLSKSFLEWFEVRHCLFEKMQD